MELGLSLGETASKPSFGIMEKATLVPNKANLGFCMALSISSNPDSKQQHEDEDEDTEEEDQLNHFKGKRIKKESSDYDDNPSRDSPLIQLDLLPNTPVPRHNQLALLCSSSHYEAANYMTKGLDAKNEKGAAVSCSPPTSSASSFHKSDEDDNGSTRKKLRLSKQQSAFLEESFKEHTTLNPKQKLALANQLNLRPRQVEVWFQNRRARTKLKQTEVDCEYLRRCCETLTEENRRLHKEVQELRALKTSYPMYMQLPPTTLTMCPSCERVATTNTPPATQPDTSKATDLSLSTRPRFQPLFNKPRNS